MSVFNAKPLLLFENVLGAGTLTATDTDADDKFDVSNIVNQVIYQLWKAASSGTKYIMVDLNKVLNAGGETGDGSNWTLNDATVENTNPNSGTYSFELIATGSDVDGAETDKATVDTTKTSRLKTKHDVTARSAGNYKAFLHFWDSEDNLISTTTLNTWVAVTGAYEEVSKSIGPTGANIVYPAGTASISVQDGWDGTPTGTAYMDDVIFYEEFDPDTVGIANHNLWDSNATVSIESSVADEEVIGATWVEQLAGFTPDDDKLILKEFTAVGTAQRAWRIKLVTANMAAYVGDIKLGAKLEFPRWIQGPLGPRPRKVKGKVADNDEGQFIQRSVIRKEAEVNITFRFLTSSFVWGTLVPAFDNYLISGTFYFSWDIDQHENQKMICYMPDGAEMDPQYEGRRLSVSMRLMPMPEED